MRSEEDEGTWGGGGRELSGSVRGESEVGGGEEGKRE